MSDYLPPDPRRGLSGARRNQLLVEARGTTFRVLRLSDRGFVLSAEDAQHLPGLVNLYDGARHLCQCLIVAAETEDGETTFEYKRRTMPLEAPPRDFDQSVPDGFPAPTALP